MSILKLVLKAAAPLPDIEKSERYLFIGPHPDDIEIGAGATAAKLAAMGKSGCFLICLDGRYGSKTIPPDELVGIRKKEACASAKMLGVSDVRFLELSDGGFYEPTSCCTALHKLSEILSPMSYLRPTPASRASATPTT